MVDSGVWRGHEILILVYGPAEPAFGALRRLFRRREPAAPRPFLESDFFFTADYWQVDPKAQGGEEPDRSFSSLIELEQWMGTVAITWYGPLESVDAVGKVLG